MSGRSKKGRPSEGKHARMVKAAAFLIAGLIIFFGGNAWGISSVLEAHDDRRLQAEGVRTTGIITNVEFYTDGKRREYKDMTVSFLTEDRRVYGKRASERYNNRVEGSKSTVAGQLYGEKRVVFYDRSDPTNSVIEGAPQSFGIGYLAIMLSLGFGASFMWTAWVGLRSIRV